MTYSLVFAVAISIYTFKLIHYTHMGVHNASTSWSLLRDQNNKRLANAGVRNRAHICDSRSMAFHKTQKKKTKTYFFPHAFHRRLGHSCVYIYKIKYRSRETIIITAHIYLQHTYNHVSICLRIVFFFSYFYLIVIHILMLWCGGFFNIDLYTHILFYFFIANYQSIATSVFVYNV